jgi:hypothetical protein
VDDEDLPGGYDPRDHFDNGYIEESWKQVGDRLEQFKTAGVRNLELFHCAHAIGDFYAHSSYGQFAAVQNGKLALYDSSNPLASLPQLPDYGGGSGFNIASGKFSTNAALWKGSAQEAATVGKVS